MGAMNNKVQSGLDAALSIPQPLRARLMKVLSELQDIMADSNGVIVSVGMIIRLKGGETFSKMVEA